MTEPTKTRTAKVLVELQVPEEWGDEEVLSSLADYGFTAGRMVKDEEPAAKAAGPEFDNYGNRFDGKANKNSTHDAYGNPYDGTGKKETQKVRGPGTDAYGNKY